MGQTLRGDGPLKHSIIGREASEMDTKDHHVGGTRWRANNLEDGILGRGWRDAEHLTNITWNYMAFDVAREVACE